MMKLVLHILVILCFTTHVSAVDFTTLAETRGLVQTRADGHGTLDLVVPVGTTGKVSKIIRYLAKNNRTGEFGYAIALKVDHVGSGQTLLETGETIILYYSSEASERILKITDSKHREIKDATQAKWGITTVSARIEQPIPKPSNSVAKIEGCASPLGQQNGQAIKDSIQCLINQQKATAKSAESKQAMPTQTNVTNYPTVVLSSSAPKVNSAAEGEILSYMNNVVWNDIQNDSRFNTKHIHAISERDAARLAEFEKRKKVNVQVAPLLIENASMNGLDVNSTVALVRTESKLNPDTCSHAGACGLFQIMLKTARDYSGNPKLTKKELRTISTNIQIGTKVFKDYLNREHGNMDQALIAYNCGPHCQEQVSKGKKPEPPETKDYVKRFYANKEEVDTLTKKVHDYVIVMNAKAGSGSRPAS